MDFGNRELSQLIERASVGSFNRGEKSEELVGRDGEKIRC